MTDTTTEAVERLAASCEEMGKTRSGYEGRASHLHHISGHLFDAAATLRALAQERDAARRLNAEYEDHIGAQDAQLATARLDRDKAEAERDAARMCAEAEAEIANEMKAERDAARAVLRQIEELAADTPTADDAERALTAIYELCVAALAAKGEA